RDAGDATAREGRQAPSRRPRSSETRRASSSATGASHGGVVAGHEIETQWPDQHGRALATQHRGYVGVEALVQQWRDDAALFRRYREVPLADWLEDRAAELGEAVKAQDDEVVTLSEAARIEDATT